MKNLKEHQHWRGWHIEKKWKVLLLRICIPRINRKYDLNSNCLSQFQNVWFLNSMHLPCNKITFCFIFQFISRPYHQLVLSYISIIRKGRYISVFTTKLLKYIGLYGNRSWFKMMFLTENGKNDKILWPH